MAGSNPLRHGQICPADDANIAAAAARIAAGACIGVPTETVYGLAGDATNPAAIAAIYAAKGRPSFNPLIVHVADMEMAEKIVSMKSRFNKQATIDARKATLKEWSSGHLPAIRNRVTAVGQQLTQGTAMLREQNQPLILAMKVEAGVVVEAYHLAR